MSTKTYISALELANDLGLPLADLTLTPSFVLGIDKRQMDQECHLHNLQYGLDIGYDLSSALNIPEQYGSVTVTGFLYYSDAINTDAINDEFRGEVLSFQRAQGCSFN